MAARTRELLDRGLPTEEVVAKLASEFTLTRRRAWRAFFGWTQEETAERINNLLDDPEQTVSASRISDAERWPYARDVPPIPVWRMLASVYRIHPSAMFEAREIDHLPRGDLLKLGLDLPGESTLLPAPTAKADEVPPVDLQALLERDEVRSRRTLDLAVVSNTADLELDDLEHRARDLVREHLHVNSIELFLRTRSLRDEVNDRLDGIQGPRTRTRLLEVGAIATIMLADTNASAGELERAERLAEIAYRLAVEAGHTPLQRWARGNLASSVAHWRGDTRRAVRLLRSTAGLPASPIEHAMDHTSLAVYEAGLNNASAALDALAAARSFAAGSAGGPDFLSDWGGLFAYPEEKRMQVEAAALLHVHEYEEANRVARHSIEVYESSPRTSRAFGNEAAARADAAHAEARLGNLDAATETIGPVLDLPKDRRHKWVVDRVRAVGAPLRLSGDPESRDLGRTIKAIEGFGGEVDRPNNMLE